MWVATLFLEASKVFSLLENVGAGYYKMSILRIKLFALQAFLINLILSQILETVMFDDISHVQGHGSALYCSWAVLIIQLEP